MQLFLSYFFQIQEMFRRFFILINELHLEQIKVPLAHNIVLFQISDFHTLQVEVGMVK